MKRFFLILLLLLGISVVPAQEKQKIIFDCDLGDDIDDAYALALVAISPEFDVLGITMDYGNTPARARLACKMLSELKRTDIPVYVGRKTKEHYSGQFKYAEGFEEYKPQEQPAADFIIEQLNESPGEIILFTVGPVSTMKDILERDPEALTKAKAVYSMYGSFYMGYGKWPVPHPEWNVVGDMEASKLFIESGADFTFAPLDITTFVHLEFENRKKLAHLGTPLGDMLSRLIQLWDWETPSLYDVVAVGMALWPDLFTTRPAHVNVIDGGYTVIDESKEPNAQVGLRINTDEFLKRLMERYVNYNP